MIEKKIYLWKLATFLNANSMTMSGEELADHLNRNNFLTSYGTEYQGGRGTYRLISETYNWVKDVMGTAEAAVIAEAFVKPDGTHAWEN
jgi:hypothetical protein